MTDFNYPKTRDWMAEYAMREFENEMAKNPLLDPESWTIQIEDNADFCGSKIDYKRKIYIVLILARQ